MFGCVRVRVCVCVCVCMCVCLSLCCAFSVVALLGDVDIIDRAAGRPDLIQHHTSSLVASTSARHISSHFHLPAVFTQLSVMKSSRLSPFLFAHSLCRPNLFSEPGFNPRVPHLIGFLPAVSSFLLPLSTFCGAHLSTVSSCASSLSVQLPLEPCPPYSLCLNDILQITCHG